MCEAPYWKGSPLTREESLAAGSAWSKLKFEFNQWLGANKGFDYNCFTFVTNSYNPKNYNESRNVLLVEGDAPDRCAAKLAHLALAASNGSNPTHLRYPAAAVVLYSDRNSQGEHYTDANASVAGCTPSPLRCQTCGASSSSRV